MNIESFYKVCPTRSDCLERLGVIRWGDVPICPYCQAKRVSRLEAQRRLHCNACNSTFSATVRTPFHHTHIPLQKCFYAALLIVSSHDRVTGRMLSRSLNISKDAACKLLTKIDIALHDIDQRMIVQEVAKIGGSQND